ncbi:MAG TPA: hypothetical protein ENI86_16290 [Acidimicrobiales bacterium]|nr:hypothetical protein [Acidimicrobiales bacterium]
MSIASTLGLVAGLGLGGRTAPTGGETGAAPDASIVPDPTPATTTTTSVDPVLEAAPGSGPVDDPFTESPTTASPPTTESRYPSVVPPPPPPVTVSDGS